jgi:hypothetical protein
MDKTDEFVRRTRIDASAEEVFAWHARPGALQRLTPPWEPVEVVSEEGGLRNGAEVTLRVHAGPVAVRWVARISDCVPGRQFRDTQVRGPFAFWQHTHCMQPDGPAACTLEDRIVYALPFGPLGRWIGGRLVRRKLDRLFEYRHLVTAESVKEWTKRAPDPY